MTQEELLALPIGTPLMTRYGNVVVVHEQRVIRYWVGKTEDGEGFENPFREVYVRERLSKASLGWPVNPTQVRMLTSRELILLEDAP